MIKLRNLILNEDVKEFDVRSENDLQTLDEIIDLCENMGKDTPVLWRGMRVKFSYPFYKVIQDTGDNDGRFRGGNLGARTIMNYLGIKKPAFAYFGNMQTITRLFGTTFAIILKKPYRLFQSPVVDDVMVWAQPMKYIEKHENGGLYRQSTGERTEQEQIDKAIEGAKTYKQLTKLQNLDDTKNEIIIDAPEYWIINVNRLHSMAGKFVKQFHKEKKAVSFSRVTDTSDYIENYGEILEILYSYRKFTMWKLKNPR